MENTSVWLGTNPTIVQHCWRHLHVESWHPPPVLERLRSRGKITGAVLSQGLVEAWVGGSDWDQVTKDCSLDPGDVARLLSRTADLLRQVIPDPEPDPWQGVVNVTMQCCRHAQSGSAEGPCPSTWDRRRDAEMLNTTCSIRHEGQPHSLLSPGSVTVSIAITAAASAMPPFAAPSKHQIYGAK